MNKEGAKSYNDSCLDSLQSSPLTSSKLVHSLVWSFYSIITIPVNVVSNKSSYIAQESLARSIDCLNSEDIFCWESEIEIRFNCVYKNGSCYMAALIPLHSQLQKTNLVTSSIL